jgi:hypothetical protein
MKADMSTTHIRSLAAGAAPAVALAATVLVVVSSSGNGHVTRYSTSSHEARSINGATTAADSVSSVTGATPVETYMTIDPDLGETLSPPTPSQIAKGPAMTADQAWSAWMRTIGAPGYKPSDDLTPYLGRLTLPLHAENTLVFGFESPPEGCLITGTPGSEPDPSMSCRAWTFLDATTGTLIDRTSQEIAK